MTGYDPARVEDLLDLSVDDVLDAFASTERVPAGGSAAALAAAIAAGLTAKAARLSRDSWPEAGGAVAQAQALRLRAAPLAQSTARAFEDAVALLEGAGVEGDRDRLLGRALSRAADVPLHIVEVAADVAALAHEVGERCDADLRPDVAAAALLAQAAARSAARLVEINLATTPDDVRVDAARSLAAAASGWAESALRHED